MGVNVVEFACQHWKSVTWTLKRKDHLWFVSKHMNFAVKLAKMDLDKIAKTGERTGNNSGNHFAHWQHSWNALFPNQATFIPIESVWWKKQLFDLPKTKKMSLCNCKGQIFGFNRVNANSKSIFSCSKCTSTYVCVCGSNQNWIANNFMANKALRLQFDGNQTLSIHLLVCVCVCWSDME